MSCVALCYWDSKASQGGKCVLTTRPPPLPHTHNHTYIYIYIYRERERGSYSYFFFQSICKIIICNGRVWKYWHFFRLFISVTSPIVRILTHISDTYSIYSISNQFPNCARLSLDSVSYLDKCWPLLSNDIAWSLFYLAPINIFHRSILFSFLLTFLF